VSDTFTCADCGAQVWVADAPSWARRVRPLCFICDWVRAEHPDDAEKRDELRRLVNRE
jgi:hypothetical protein